MNSKSKEYRRTKTGVLSSSFSHQKKRRDVFYTFDELKEKFINDLRYNRLFDEWEKSNFKLELRPTIDRINCKQSYTLNNIHILTWEENRYKQRMELKLLRGKKVRMLDFSGNLIETFYSIRNASKKTKINKSSISNCANNQTSMAGGYNWEFELASIRSV